MSEVLTNLIFNSVDAITKYGIILLRTRFADNHVILEVSDTGSGMTEEVKKHCFEPFYTTKGDGRTGMGLSLVYNIIQHYRGTIEIESDMVKGTTFIIHLPVIEQNEDKRQKADVFVMPKHILVVEDEFQIQDVLYYFQLETRLIIFVVPNKVKNILILFDI